MSFAAAASMLLTGTHGTSKSRAEAIVKAKKFNASPYALLGIGAYFWAYEDDIAFATRLAMNWSRFASAKHDAYKGDADASPAVLSARIEVSQDAYFDAGSEKFLNLLVKTAEARSIGSAKADFNRLRVLLIKEIEDEQGFSYSVIRANVEVPGMVKGEEGAPHVYWAAKQAPCYVVTANALGLINHIELVEA